MTANQNDAQRPRISMVAAVSQKWQYGQELNCTLERLNELGQDSWELVGSPVIARTVLGSSGQLLYVFKRPIQTPQR